MNRIRKLAAVVKEGVSNTEKIKKGLKVLKNQGPVIFKERLSNSINYELKRTYMRSENVFGRKRSRSHGI